MLSLSFRQLGCTILLVSVVIRKDYNQIIEYSKSEPLDHIDADNTNNIFVNISKGRYHFDLRYYSLCNKTFYHIADYFDINSDINRIIFNCISNGDVVMLMGNIRQMKVNQIYHSEKLDFTETIYNNNIKSLFTNRELFISPTFNDCKYIHQYNYRYNISIIDFEYKLTSVKDTNFNGCFSKMNDGSLLIHHNEGIPKKVSLEWHTRKSEYTAYFWFEDEKICSIFERFYGAHPDTKTDFIIRIDAEKKKYELALFRQGLKEPQIIPEDAYQLLVFKNKFEDYRSDNYNQDRGAWIW